MSRSGHDYLAQDDAAGWGPFSLSRKTALITGGATGIGFGIARCFVSAGARVAIVARRRDALDSAAAELGPSAIAEAFDVTQVDRLPELVRRVEARTGPLSILVHCAGNHVKKTALDTDVHDMEALLRTHVVSGFELARTVAADMLRRSDGSLLFIASMSSFLAMPSVSAYSTAKTAVLGLTRSLAADFAPHGVRVNAIAPGWIDTPLLRQALDGDSARREKILGRTPLRRLGSTEDIGWASVYLCSDAARFVTGMVLPVDGGASVGF